VSEKELTPAERARAEEDLRRAIEGEPAPANLSDAIVAFEDQMVRLGHSGLHRSEQMPRRLRACG
jgi:hypothetical protein